MPWPRISCRRCGRRIATSPFTRWRKAVELAADNYEARFTLASQLAAHNDWTGAEQHALEAKRIDSARSGGYALVAAVDAHAERWSDLDAVLEASRAAVP